jgi:hypothetical protein
MTVAQKAVGIVGVVMVITALVLPGRQTVPVLNSVTSLATGVIHSSETGAA